MTWHNIQIYSGVKGVCPLPDFLFVVCLSHLNVQIITLTVVYYIFEKLSLISLATPRSDYCLPVLNQEIT